LDRAVIEAAAACDWVLSAAQLGAIGLTPNQIGNRVRRGLLHRWHRGVYAVGRPRLGFEGECRAAFLACGPHSAISHASGLGLWGVRAARGAIHVSVPRGRAGHPGLCVHRPRLLHRDEVVERDGVAVTTVGRTLLDVAGNSSAERIAWLMHEAAVQRVLDLREVWMVIDRHPNHRGRWRLERALEIEVEPTHSGLERELLSICKSARVPAPRVNQHVWSIDRLEEADFHWPEVRLVLEVDGARYHSTRWRRKKDAEKTARLEAAGWTVCRFSEIQVRLDARGVADEIRRLVADLGRSTSRQA
jgi:very-short-patch-repair endonuclease